MADPVRPVLLQEPQARQKWVNPDGTPSLYAHKYHHAVFMRLGAYNDDVWRALGVGFTGLTQINQVNQRVSEVEAATAAVQGAIAGLRGDPRLEDAVTALQVAITALVQVQARSSGEADKRIGDLDRLVSSLGARLTKATQAIQLQTDQASADAAASRQLQVAFIQRAGADQLRLSEDLDAVVDGFAREVYDSLSATAPVVFDNLAGVFSLTASLTSLGGVTTAADKGYYTTAANTWASHDLTSFGRSVSALADAAAGRTLFGLGSLATASTINDSDWSGTDLAIANGGTGASTASAARSNLGLGSLAVLNTVNNGDWSGADLAVANGGTGSSTAADARTALGLAIGSDVAAFYAPRPGWAAATGTATRTTFDTATVTLPQLAERVKALIDDLTTNQMIGA